MEYLFPSTMVALSVAACAVYAWRGDWGKEWTDRYQLVGIVEDV